jgi:hypothetical protein
MSEQEKDYIADATAAENVRSYLDGALKNPFPGTLAHRVAGHVGYSYKTGVDFGRG